MKIMPLLVVMLVAAPLLAGKGKPVTHEGTSEPLSPKWDSPDVKYPYSLSNNENRMIKSVNEYRAKHGLEPLTVDPCLMKVARAAAPYYSHCIGGKWCWTRCHEAGFSGWASDDIANGYESPEEAVQGWATSDGHARQMRGQFKMNGQWCDYHFNRIGVGIQGKKYIAIFGHKDESKSRRHEE